MHELTRIFEALDVIAAELERLRVLKEYELGIELKEAPRGAALTSLKSRSKKGLGPGHPSGGPALA